MEYIYADVIHPAVGYLITALLAAFLGWVGKTIKDLKRRKSEIIEKLNSMMVDLDENTVLTCKAIIYSPIFSLDEKLKAFRVYRSKGGNGLAYKHMSEILGHDVDDYLAHRENAQ